MSKIRRLKNSHLSTSDVNNNDLYNFSKSQSLSIYPLDAVYTFIPKNACSTLRYSIAIANGFIRSIKDIDWIHSNNRTFIATQREIARAKYTFVILRCPFRRVASCFLDKLVGGEVNVTGPNGKPVDINFNQFLQMVQAQNRNQMNYHWRNQSDFLHYEHYDDYFSIESFENAIDTLKSRGLTIYDTRQALNHDLSNLEKIQGNYSKIEISKLRKLRQEGVAPSYDSMFSKEEKKLVNQIYKDDINLYQSHFGKDGLLF